MKFSYSVLPKKFTGLYKDSYLPMVDIVIGNGNYIFRTRALIDSGASITIVNSFIAEKILRLDWKKGTKSFLRGVVDKPHEMYINTIQFEIFRLEKSLRNINVGVVESDNFGILLGEIGFFEFYDVVLCNSKKFFHVNISSN